MDHRLSPLESCGGHEHLETCDSCKTLLEEFCLLHQSLQSFCKARFELASSHESGWQGTSDSAARTFEPGFVPSNRKWLSRSFRRFPETFAFAACTALLCAFLFSPGFGSTGRDPGSFLATTSGQSNPRNSNLVVIAAEDPVPYDESDSAVENLPRWPPINIRTAVASREIDQPVQSFASCIRIADQMPGVPPLRWSLTHTVNWFWNSLPELPRIPALPEFIPGFGYFESTPSIFWI